MKPTNRPSWQQELYEILDLSVDQEIMRANTQALIRRPFVADLNPRIDFLIRRFGGDRYENMDHILFQGRGSWGKVTTEDTPDDTEA